VHSKLSSLVVVLVALACAACSSSGDKAQGSAATGFVNWSTHGADSAETRFSPLTQVTSKNVQQLGLAWSYDLNSTRGVEATPLVVDGIMYVTAPWSVVHAIDARSGKGLWTFDPTVERKDSYRACCDVVNRGVAYSDGRVYVGALDGRLIALEAATGKKLWEQDTVIDRSRAYTSTGAPRVYKGKVVIGNAGGEYGVRGYVSAFDGATGKLAWRWYTVPGDPSKPFEDESMAKAAKTWDPSGKYWETGGGGTVWNAMAFDPELNLLYIGTDNGTPWAARKRSPKGGDNLYLCSIVALDLETGRYVWHYQENPADNWDFSAVQDIILADLNIDGKPRKAILHAPKNGFFFVIDRTNGEFISARNFVDVNWASGYGADGRPVELPGAREKNKPYEMVPSAFGAHNWQSMSWNPALGLAYIPAQHVPLTMSDSKEWVGYGSKPLFEPHSNIGFNLATVVNATPPTAKPFGRLIAWDPVAQKARWSVEHVAPWNGGTLTTAGNLVFQGSADGRFVAYDAGTGAKLWDSPAGTGIVAAPVTYEIDGKQYVSIAVGWGGVFGLSARATELKTPGAVYTFALGGTAKPPAFVDYQLRNLLSGVKYRPEDVQPGAGLYVSNCAFCHGVPGVDKGGNIPNLGYSATEVVANLETFVFNGPLVSRGMPDFTGKLTAAEVQKIKAFIQGTADSVRPQVATAKQ
jgi:PQQ-dependent dehydrogenase (methanol/ethanol family)